jgi:hypothetical protein
MYISPFIFSMLFPEACGDDAFGGGLAACIEVSPRKYLLEITTPHTDKIGGTSTCCMPFLAWIEALILAAAAAVATLMILCVAQISN